MGRIRRKVREALSSIRRGASSLLFERRYAVTTCGRVGLDELGLDGAERIEYVPSGWRTIRSVLPPREVSPTDVFIDFGAGKGRMLIQAARYPFRRVIGVELSAQLCDIARANIARARRHLRCPVIDLVQSDALAYEVPDDVTVAFFYNPFTGTTFARVVRKLIDSYDRNPRRIRIIYNNPEEERSLLGTHRVRRLRGTGGEGGSPRVGLYEIVGRAAADCRLASR